MRTGNDFDDVRRLLRCKQYEQPPPGYFSSFSDKIIARIEAEQATPYSSWWSWFVDRFDAKPVLVCAYGLAVSSLLFMGFRLAQVFDADTSADPALNGAWLALTPGSPLSLAQTFGPDNLAQESELSLGWNPAHRSLPGDKAGYPFLPERALRVQPVIFNLERK